MSQLLAAKWQKDDFEIMKNKKVPTQLFSINQTDFFPQLYTKTDVFKLSPKAPGLGWALNGFTVTHWADDSAFQITDATNNALLVSLAGNAVNVKFYGPAIGTMQTFLCNFFLSVFPDRRLQFENLTEEQKQQKIKQQQLEDQQDREEKVRRFRERQEKNRIQKLLDTLTEEDYTILRLRKEGASLWTIAEKLDVSLMRVRYKLQVMNRIPQLADDWIMGKPMSRKEYLGNKNA